MRARTLVIIFILGTSAAALVGWFQRAPGYMDAEYYYAAGRRLAEGQGFSEEILWNYLDNPQGLPHPSHAYWSPLVSLLAAAGMRLSGSTGFEAAQTVMIVVAGLAAAVSGALAYRFTGREEDAWLAGLLGAFPGFYFSYMPTTDAFGIYILLGASAFLLVDKISRTAQQGRSEAVWIFLLGVVAGSFHLARADGLFWLAAALLALPRNRRRWLVCAAILAGGYLLVMGGWMLRNWLVFGALFAPGAAKMLWLLDYDELFSYPAEALDAARWLASDWGVILQARGYALWQNVQTALVVQGEIFLSPLVMLGLWRLRGKPPVRMGVSGWLLALAAMTVLFPFAGWRGGFFHAGAAVQSLVWAATPTGLDVFITWGVRARGWNRPQARQVFSAGLIILAVMLSLLTAYSRVIGGNLREPSWNHGAAYYSNLEQILQAAGAEEGEIVMVNNAPGYYAANRRPVISIPNGPPTDSLAAAKRYGARYLLLEANHPRGLEDLYQNPRDVAGWRFVQTWQGVHIFLIDVGSE